MSLIQMYDINKNKIDLNKYGLNGLKLTVPSPSYRTTRETVQGRHGDIPIAKDLNPRNLVAKFIVDANDYEDSLLLRDELYDLFSKGSKFYIGETKQPGKLWLVECIEEWEPERINTSVYSVDIPLIAEKGMAESLGTTLDSFDWDSELWQWGMGIPFDDYSYEHTTNQFTIYNAGKVLVDPRYMELKITIKATASEYIELVNKTTSETFRYNGKLTTNDELVIDRIRVTKNSLSVFRDTNKKLITLVPMANEFEIKGATVERILFDFRFHYL